MYSVQKNTNRQSSANQFKSMLPSRRYLLFAGGEAEGLLSLVIHHLFHRLAGLPCEVARGEGRKRDTGNRYAFFPSCFKTSKIEVNG